MGEQESGATRTPRLAATLIGRADILAAALDRHGLPALLLGTAPAALGAAMARIPAGSRVTALTMVPDVEEWELRLAEVAAGVHPVVALDWRLAWDARLVVALRRWSPRLVGIETGGDMGSGRTDLLALELLVARVRRILPAAEVVIAAAPVGLRARARLECMATPAELHGPLLPADLAIRIVRVRTERERWEGLLDAASATDKPLLVVTPSRLGAIRVAARLGPGAISYHGGLSDSERATVIDAFRRGQSQFLVTTQTLPGFDDLPPPAAVVLTHPPRRLELVVRLGAWAARSPRPGPLIVLHGDQDMGKPRGGFAGGPGLSDLRVVYRALRRLAQGGYMRVAPDTLSQTSPLFRGQPHLVAWCLDALERAGYLERGDDLGRAVAITVLTGDRESLVVRGLPAWSPGPRAPLDPLAAALSGGENPERWQRLRLEAALAGLLLYRAAGREPLYRFGRSGREAAARLQALVQEQAEIASWDTRAVTQWLDSPGCRVRALAAEMGLPSSGQCGRCDRCAPGASTGETAGNEPWQLALRALAEVPIALPEGAAERIVRQALRRAGRLGENKTTTAALARLLADGLVRREAGELQARLLVSEAGRALLTARRQAR